MRNLCILRNLRILSMFAATLMSPNHSNLFYRHCEPYRTTLAQLETKILEFLRLSHLSLLRIFAVT